MFVSMLGTLLATACVFSAILACIPRRRLDAKSVAALVAATTSSSSASSSSSSSSGSSASSCAASSASSAPSPKSSSTAATAAAADQASGNQAAAAAAASHDAHQQRLHQQLQLQLQQQLQQKQHRRHSPDAHDSHLDSAELLVGDAGARQAQASDAAAVEQPRASSAARNPKRRPLVVSAGGSVDVARPASSASSQFERAHSDGATQVAAAAAPALGVIERIWWRLLRNSNSNNSDSKQRVNADTRPTISLPVSVATHSSRLRRSSALSNSLSMLGNECTAASANRANEAAVAAAAADAAAANPTGDFASSSANLIHDSSSASEQHSPHSHAGSCGNNTTTTPVLHQLQMHQFAPATVATIVSQPHYVCDWTTGAQAYCSTAASMAADDPSQAIYTNKALVWSAPDAIAGHHHHYGASYYQAPPPPPTTTTTSYATICVQPDNNVVTSTSAIYETQPPPPPPQQHHYDAQNAAAPFVHTDDMGDAYLESNYGTLCKSNIYKTLKYISDNKQTNGYLSAGNCDAMYAQQQQVAAPISTNTNCHNSNSASSSPGSLVTHHSAANNHLPTLRQHNTYMDHLATAAQLAPRIGESLANIVAGQQHHTAVHRQNDGSTLTTTAQIGELNELNNNCLYNQQQQQPHGLATHV